MQFILCGSVDGNHFISGSSVSNQEGYQSFPYKYKKRFTKVYKDGTNDIIYSALHT